MALAEMLPSKQRAPVKKSYAIECPPFDVDLLCAKLEDVKLERDLRRARRRHRDVNGTRMQEPPAAESHRLSMTVPRPETRSNVQQIEESKRPLSANHKKDEPSKQLFATFSFGKSKDESVRDVICPNTFTSGSEHSRFSRRSSTGGSEAGRSKVLDAHQRKSVPVARHAYFDDLEEAERDSARIPGPSDPSKRRSKTFPLQLSKLTPKTRPVSAYAYSDTLKSRAREDESPGSPMGLVNEYTISFDLADMLRDESRRSSNQAHETRHISAETPPLATGLHSRSLLNLSYFRKKDKTEVRTNEMKTVWDNVQENPRPLTSANGHHVRQRSLPIHLHSDALMRCKREEREKKRRTFIGFFKIF